ncbi:MAG: helix-turn-helix domain-containing protein [Rhodobacteraceae bacterium]|nr:helix-turn-helix domain-containing protein [Paracoccaceae bacterium]
MSAHKSIMAGLEETFEYVSGTTDGTMIHEIEIPEFDVAKIRQNTGLSQSEFAKSIGVAKGTLVNWEHGRRHPTGPAQVLLALISKNPAVVQEVLG